MAYNDFTEMPVWNLATTVVDGVYKLASILPKSEEYALSSQMKRAALSIPANIAEAFGISHSKDKVNFYLYARGSAFEVRSHLLVGRNLAFFDDSQINQLNIDCNVIIESLNKLMKTLRSQTNI